MPEPCWNIGSNNTYMDICFRNNAINTNTQQSSPLTNFWLKQIMANLHKNRGIQNNTISSCSMTPYLMKKQSTHTIYKDTLDTLPQVITNTYSRRRSSLIVSLKRFQKCAIEEFLTQSSGIAWTNHTWRMKASYS